MGKISASNTVLPLNAAPYAPAREHRAVLPPHDLGAPATGVLATAFAAVVGASLLRTRARVINDRAGRLTIDSLRQMPALRQTLEGGRLLRTGTPTELDSIERLLREGRVVRNTIGDMPDRGISGPLQCMVVEAGDGSKRTAQVLRKPPHAQPAQEDFGYQLARTLGIDHLFAKTGLRPDGSALTTIVPGVQARKAGVHDVRALEQTLARGYARTHPQLPARERTAAARIDRQLLQFYDYLVATADRHNRNVMVDAAQGSVHFIDLGRAGAGETFDRLRPALATFYQGAGRRIELDPVTVDVIRRRLDADALARLHVRLGASRDGARTWSLRGPVRLADERYLHTMQARLQHVLDNGWYEYTPLRPFDRMFGHFGRIRSMLKRGE